MQMGMNKDAVQNERQPRNTATLRPESLAALDSERILREAVGAFGYVFQIWFLPKGDYLAKLPEKVVVSIV